MYLFHEGWVGIILYITGFYGVHFWEVIFLDISDCQASTSERTSTARKLYS